MLENDYIEILKNIHNEKVNKYLLLKMEEEAIKMGFNNTKNEKMKKEKGDEMKIRIELCNKEKDIIEMEIKKVYKQGGKLLFFKIGDFLPYGYDLKSINKAFIIEGDTKILYYSQEELDIKLLVEEIQEGLKGIYTLEEAQTKGERICQDLFKNGSHIAGLMKIKIEFNDGCKTSEDIIGFQKVNINSLAGDLEGFKITCKDNAKLIYYLSQIKQVSIILEEAEYILFKQKKIEEPVGEDLKKELDKNISAAEKIDIKKINRSLALDIEKTKARIKKREEQKCDCKGTLHTMYFGISVKEENDNKILMRWNHETEKIECLSSIITKRHITTQDVSYIVKKETNLPSVNIEKFGYYQKNMKQEGNRNTYDIVLAQVDLPIAKIIDSISSKPVYIFNVDAINLNECDEKARDLIYAIRKSQKKKQEESKSKEPKQISCLGDLAGLTNGHGLSLKINIDSISRAYIIVTGMDGEIYLKIMNVGRPNIERLKSFGFSVECKLNLKEYLIEHMKPVGGYVSECFQIRRIEKDNTLRFVPVFEPITTLGAFYFTTDDIESLRRVILKENEIKAPQLEKILKDLGWI